MSLIKKNLNIIFCIMAIFIYSSICLASGKKTNIFPNRNISTNKKLKIKEIKNPKTGKKVLVVDREIIVEFKPGTKNNLIFSLHNKHKVRVLGKIKKFNVEKLQIPENKSIYDIIKIYEKNPNVKYAEPNYVFELQALPDDPWFLTYQLNTLNMIKAPQAWDIEKGSSNIIIGFLDTGIDLDHPDLRNRLWVNSDEIPGNGIDDDNNGHIDDVNGVDIYYSDSDPSDNNGHGTAVAGIACADTDNGIGIAGVTWAGKIMPVQIFGIEGVTSGWEVAQGLLYAIGNGAKIIHMSVGMYGYCGNWIEGIIRNAYNNQGLLFVAPCGNDNIDEKLYPAALTHVISVMALSKTNGNIKADFSNFGDSIDVAAPLGFCSTYWNDRYTLGFGGTCSAAPYVSALAALIWSKYPNLSNDEVRQIIFQTADDIGEPGKDEIFGYGRINFEAALGSTNIGKTPIAFINEPSIKGINVKGTIEIRGSAYGSAFSNFAVKVGKGFNPTNWIDTGITLTNGGNIAVTNGMLATWDTTQVDDDKWTIMLVVYASNFYYSTSFITVIVDRNLQMGFPVNSNPPHYPSINQDASPNIADINNDGYQEIICPAGLKIHVINYQGSLFPGFPAILHPGGRAYEDNKGTSAIGDIDNDNDLEIFVAERFWGASLGAIKVHSIHHDATSVNGWPQTANDCSTTLGGEIALEDIDGDGDLEVILAMKGELSVRHGDGTFARGWPQKFTNENDLPNSVTVGDVDYDGDMEIVVTFEDNSQNKGIYIWHHDGRLMTSFFTNYGFSIFSPPALGDIDGDGDLEIVHHALYDSYTGTGSISVWHHNGVLFSGTWPKPAVGGSDSPPALADFDNDNLLEIVVCTNEKVYIFKSDGSIFPGNWPQTIKISIGGETSYSSPVIADVDGDNELEIIITSIDKVYIFKKNGSSMTNWPKTCNGNFWLISPAVGDLDQDGDIEIIAGNHKGIYVWDMDGIYNESKIAWSMYKHDSQLTGVYHNPGKPYLRLNYFNVDDDNSSPSSGNNDGGINAGETIELYVSIKNKHSIPASTVSVSITTTNSNISVIDNSSSYGTIPGHDNVLSSDPFVFQVSPSAPSGEIVILRLTMTDLSGNVFKDVIIFRINPLPPPYLEVVSPASNTHLKDNCNIIGTVKSPILDNFIIELGREGEIPISWTSLGITLISNGLFAITNNILGILNTALYSDGPWIIKLKATDSYGQVSEIRVPVYIDKNYQAGWPRDIGEPISASPGIEDLDGDGKKEIVICTELGNVYVFNYDGSIRQGWPQKTVDIIITAPALADMDNDGRIEIAVGTYNTGGLFGAGEKLYVFKDDGTHLAGWPVRVENSIESSPVIVDIDKDYDLEIFIGSHDGNLYAFNSDGTPFTNWPYKFDGIISCTPAAGDVNGDNEIEIVGSGGIKLRILDKEAFLLSWYNRMHIMKSSPALGDIDNNGSLDIIASQGSFGTVINAMGPDWSKDLGSTLYSSAALGDISGDNKL